MSREDDFFGDFNESLDDIDTGQEDTSEPLMDESPAEMEHEPALEEPARPAARPKPKPKPKAKKKATTKPKAKAKKKKASKTTRKPAPKKTAKKKATTAKKKKAARPKPKK